MDAFHGAGEGKRIVDLATARLCRGETKDRTQPFAAGEQTVSHRFVNRRRLRVLLWKKPAERAVDLLLPRSDVRLEIHAGRIVAALDERRIIFLSFRRL